MFYGLLQPDIRQPRLCSPYHKAPPNLPQKSSESHHAQMRRQFAQLSNGGDDGALLF